MKNAHLLALNEREPRPTMILCLLTEAQVGKVSTVSLIDAMEFRRDQYEITASEFSAILGMSKTHYSEFVNGRRNLPLNARIRAYAIGVPAEALLQPGSEMKRSSLASKESTS